MPEFKKSSGFKMKGYSYPGESPLKGKKKRLQAAADKAAAAQEQIAAFGQMQLGKKSPMNLNDEVLKIEPKKIKLLPVNKEPKLEKATKTHDMVLKEMKAERKLNRIEGLKDAGAKIVGKAGEQIVTSLIARGVDAILTPKNKKVEQKAPDQSGFGKIKFGRA